MGRVQYEVVSMFTCLRPDRSSQGGESPRLLFRMPPIARLYGDGGEGELAVAKFTISPTFSGFLS